MLISTGPASREEYERIMLNLRQADRDEMAAMGHDHASLMKNFDMIEWQAGRADGQAECVYGHHLTGWLVYFGFLGTSKVDRHMLTFTRHARRYIDQVCDKFFEYRPVVQVWEGHHQSRAWLRILGFEETGAVLWRANNRFLLVERR